MSVRGYLAAIPSAARKEMENLTFCVYVTEALKVLTENTTHVAVPGIGMADYGASITKSWSSMLEPPKPEPPKDDRPCGEIVRDMWTRIRGGKS